MVCDGGEGLGPNQVVLAVTVMVEMWTVVVVVVVEMPCAKEKSKAAWRSPRIVNRIPGSKYFR